LMPYIRSVIDDVRVCLNDTKPAEAVTGRLARTHGRSRHLCQEQVSHRSAGSEALPGGLFSIILIGLEDLDVYGKLFRS
jgi:cation transport regulator ChaC